MENSKIKSIAIVSDTFLPLIDGVCNTVVNYQKKLMDDYGIYAPAITPKQKNFDYKSYKYPVYTLPSLPLEKKIGYRGGLLLSPKTIKQLKKNRPDIIHVHTPFVALSYGIILRYIFKCPIVFTYHTKYDYELNSRFKRKFMQRFAHNLMMNQIDCVDETWTVNETVGEDLIKNGYKEPMVNMANGTEMDDKPLDPEIIKKYTEQYVAKDGRLILLFVGRQFWVKGLKITLDALAKLKKDGIKFTFISIGSGDNSNEIKNYASQIGLNDEDVKFLGAKTNKEELKAFYSVADLFLLPSVYDCSPIVIIEAAACKTPSVLIKNSDSASHKKDRVDSFLIDNNSESMYKLLVELNQNRKLIEEVSKGAFENVFISWKDAVGKAIPRYEEIIKKYKTSTRKHRPHLITFFLRPLAHFLNFLSLFVVLKKDKKTKHI